MIYLLGDVHGNFDHILPAIEADQPGDGKPKTVIFLGDLQAQRPFEEEIAPLVAAGIEVFFIHGNHDTDSRQEWDNLLSSWHRNLHGRVVEIEGLRVAGLGGTFRHKIWFPSVPVQFNAFEYFEEDLLRRPIQQSTRDRLFLRYSSAIFPDTVETLRKQRADILVTHEAPSCHRHGFDEIDALAAFMGAKKVFHGHHHDCLDYRKWDDRLGFQAYGVGFCGILDMHGKTILPGDFGVKP